MSRPTLATALVPINPVTFAQVQASTDTLAKLAEQVRTHSRSSTASIIAIGAALTQAKEHLGWGQFADWVSRECGFTVRSAQNYMQAAKLASRESEIVSLLTPAAIYRLASPKTPLEVVSRVVAMLRAGLLPTEPEIAAMIANNDPTEVDEDTDGSPTAGGERMMRDFAKELRDRLGDELTNRLARSPWTVLRKHLLQALG